MNIKLPKWEVFCYGVGQLFYQKFQKPFYYPVQRFFESLKRIYDYVPLLWKDRDWDYAYLIDLLVFKLKRMERVHLEDPHHADAKKYAAQIRFSIDNLQKASDNFYEDQEMERHDKKWGKPKYSLKKFLKSSRARAKTPKLKEQEREEYALARTRGYSQDREAFRKAMLNIAKHHRHWWT